MKPRHLALGLALLVSAGFAVFGDKTPAGDVVEAAPRQAAPPQAAPRQAAPRQAALDTSALPPTAVNASLRSAVRNDAGSGKTATPVPDLLALIPRERLMEDGEAVKEGAFAVQNWTPPPPPPMKPPPAPPPVAPPLPFIYLGKAQENGAWEVFLARGSETLIVRQQQAIDGVYRVDAIAPPTMTLTYLPLQQVQQINIGVAP